MAKWNVAISGADGHPPHLETTRLSVRFQVANHEDPCALENRQANRPCCALHQEAGKSRAFCDTSAAWIVTPARYLHQIRHPGHTLDAKHSRIVRVLKSTLKCVRVAHARSLSC